MLLIRGKIMDCHIIRIIFYGDRLFLNKNDNFIVQPVLFGCHDYKDSMGESTDLITVT